MQLLEGQVALVIDGGAPNGRAVALALAARGVRIVVAGPTEKLLGETVGEVAYGGGKARHVVADPRDPPGIGAAFARALEVFGRLDHVIATTADAIAVECIRAVAASSNDDGLRVLEPTAEERALDPDELAQRIVVRLSG